MPLRLCAVALHGRRLATEAVSVVGSREFVGIDQFLKTMNATGTFES
jgi:hypothetical protein